VLEVTDGPFAETKEQLGGYYLLDCKDLDEALDYAAKIPTAQHGRVEVRPVVVWDNKSSALKGIQKLNDAREVVLCAAVIHVQLVQSKRLRSQRRCLRH